jgi:hypothetical protein
MLCYAECRLSFLIILNVIVLSVVLLSVMALSQKDLKESWLV